MSRKSSRNEKQQYNKQLMLIVGNPNVGKSTLFNHLSQKYAVTANYPFTTVELNADSIRIEGKDYELIDTAGIYRLDNPSEEGQLTRDLIFQDRPKIIIQVIESAKLERSLLLTEQLLELGVPLIIVLNMQDELVKQGLRINSRVLSEQLGVPVLETIATEGKGIESIKKSIRKVKRPEFQRNYPYIVDLFFKEMKKQFPRDKRPPTAIFTLLALDDPFALHWIEDHYGKETVNKVKKSQSDFIDKHVVNLSITIMNSQNFWVQKITDHVVTRKSEITKYGIQKFGEWSRHPVLGWLIMMGVILMTYLVVGKFGASFLVAKMDLLIFIPITEFLKSSISVPILNRFLVGDYGLLTTGLFNAIGTVLPIITLFFLVLNLLEDIGYLSNLIILTSRVFKKFGLTGRSILPIVLGFGCKTMATLSTKVLDTKKEKFIAIFLIGLAIPCSSQLSINIAVLSSQSFGAFLIVVGVLTLIEMIAGLILNRIVPKDKQTDFIIEIPPIRLPDMKLLAEKTYYRSLWFLKEAVPLFLLGAFVLFVLNETSLMQVLEWALRPIVVGFLHLPITFSEALVMSLARSEAGAVLIMNMANEGVLNPTQIIVAVIVITLFIPCISNVMAMIKELKWRKAMLIVIVVTITSILIGGLVNLILTFFHYGG